MFSNILSFITNQIFKKEYLLDQIIHIRMRHIYSQILKNEKKIYLVNLTISFENSEKLKIIEYNFEF